MFGPPRELNKKNRLDEMKMVNETTTNCEIGSGMYSSFKVRTQGMSPGFARPIGQRRKPKDTSPSPAPGIGEVFSSFKKTNERGRNKGWGTPRTSAWMEDPMTPGVGSYNPKHEVSVHAGFSRNTHTVIATKRTTSRIKIRDPSPGPGDYVTEYSSLRRVPGKTGWRSPSTGERDGWRYNEDTPGPCYNPDDYKPKSVRSATAVQTLGGSSAPRAFIGHVNSNGFVPAVTLTDVGPGDYTPASDFNVASRTFNKYARMQSLKKSTVSSPSPHRSHSRSRSFSASSRISAHDV
eukprot:TRINITY_DN34420_c0_g1_i1.p1 TRINITY_DN34420_c0_g1~~TRINITY_DN34420_c0_g1_i1.p1  ORF type:complete len:309 (+),score=71.87 TRINITY_DN34420_c0_g1_i1:52-927(+)